MPLVNEDAHKQQFNQNININWIENILIDWIQNIDIDWIICIISVLKGIEIIDIVNCTISFKPF